MVLGSLLAASLSAPSTTWAAFEREDIEGWSVHFDQTLAGDTLKTQLRDEIRERLHEIIELLPQKRVSELQRIAIYIRNTNGPEASFFDNRIPVDANDVVKGSVVLQNPRAVLKHLHNVPSMILHELSHGYHYQVLGVQDSEIKAAYANAKQKHLYEHVKDFSGQELAVSYAMTNFVEYFALATQAYYLRARSFPFNRDELRSYDPVAFATVQHAWEDRPGPQPSFQLSLSTETHGCKALHDNAKDQSSSHLAEVVLSIRNDSSSELRLWWLPSGMEKRIFPSISPNDILSQATIPHQTWEIWDNAGCVASIDTGNLGAYVSVKP